MKKESLIKARDIIIESLNNSKIDQQDIAELMINLWHLLEPEQYEHNIKLLKRSQKRR